MPLSDREQQILSDIEARLRAEDPKFAKTVSTTTVSAHVRRKLKLAVALFAVGFVVMLLFAVHIAYGIGGFAIMLASAVYAGNMLKRLGSAGDKNARLGGQLRGGFDRYMHDKRTRRRDDDPKI